MPYMSGYHWIWMIVWPFIWLLMLFCAIFMARNFFGRGCAGAGDQKRALEILDERYARGEVGRDEYNEKKKDILGK